MDQLINAVDNITKAIQYVLYYSFKTGQFLVYLGKVLVDFSVILLNSCVTFILILFESIGAFVQDVITGFQQTLNITTQFLEEMNVNFTKTIWFTNEALNKILTFSVTLCLVPFHILWTMFIVIQHGILLCKNLVILFGSGMWFCITLIPHFILNLGSMCVSLIHNLKTKLCDLVLKIVDNMKLSISNSYEFFTDVPLEAVMGIFVATCMVYIFTQFYMIIFTYIYFQIRNTLLQIYHQLRRLRVRSRTATRTAPTRHPRIQARSRLNVSDASKISDDRFCVICQERQKCILLLPCRHVCMCDQCTIRLELYNNVCPICRNDIDDTMRIFV